ncbi:hypothetical protein G6045_17225 [Streptomyces sp. YC504]|uniref:Uncharacterized protein n=1 Tax=Streptomyces mesophilus TaxID=1775132 RepID=A0A6G4XIK6_9ACTN|nr:hypothetical protein [Streptomyces mesophilus]NGO77389.1 hypothetical protein [Streptomyces mesophilus]
MSIFGVLAAGMGIVGLIAPDALIKMMGFASAPDGGRGDGDYTVVFLTASSMAALNMGVYYVLAAASNWTAFFRWTVPFRLLTCTVFTLAVLGDRAPAGFIGVGLWEGLGAVATAIALRKDKQRAAPPAPAAAV